MQIRGINISKWYPRSRNASKNLFDKLRKGKLFELKESTTFSNLDELRSYTIFFFA